MNKIVGHFGNKFSIYLLVVVIGGLMLYYAFGYVPRNQLLLDNHGVHVLANKALAISDKYKGYDNSVNSAPISYLSKWLLELHPTLQNLYVKDQSKDSSKIYFSTSSLATYNTINRHVFDTSARVDSHLSPSLVGSRGKTIKRIWKDDRGSSYFLFTPALHFYAIERENKKPVRQYPMLKTKISDFTSNIKENDFFEDLFLLRANTCKSCAKDSLTSEPEGYGYFVLDESKLGLVKFNLSDTAKNASSGIYQETILGKQYKVYYQMIKLRTGVDVYLVGLISLDVFKADSKKVSVWFLVFCSLGALLLIFLFPVLKLFLLSQSERLSTNDISLGVFSVMLCTCLCFILAIGFYFFWGLEMERNDADIKRLANSIKSETIKETTTYDTILNSPVIFKDGKINVTLFKAANKYDFNEVFLLESEQGFMRDFHTEKDNNPNLDLFPVSVRERNYFKSIHDNNGLDYFLECINSFATGKSEVAMSAVVKSGAVSYIGVITTSLKSILQSSAPSPYKFVLLDDRGDVKFHSGWKEIKSENLLSELENGRIIDSYLKNQITGYSDFTYMRKECRGYLMPVVKNWSILVYYEKSEIYNLSAQIFIHCLISLFIIVLFCMGIHLVLKTDRCKPVLLKTNPFMYAWLNPNNFSDNSWWHIFRINIVLLIVEIIGLWILNSFVSSLFFSLLLISSSYLLNYSLLKRGISPTTLAWLIGLTILTGLLFVITSPIHFWLYILVQGWIVFVLYKSKMTRGDDMLDSVARSFFAYRFFMISWLMIIIIGPSVGFLTKHYQHETTLTAYGYLIADVQLEREKDHYDEDGNLVSLFNHSVVSEDTLLNIGASPSTYYDSVYYNQFPKFAALNNNNTTPLQFNYVPVMENLKVIRQGDMLQVSSETNKLNEPVPEIKRLAKAKNPELTFNRSFLVMVILILGLFILLWKVFSALTRKVFYIPKHSAWASLPLPSTNWGEIQFELDGVDKDQHLLHQATSKFKEDPRLLSGTKASWEHEKLILELQNEQHNRYDLRWSSCSQEEKFFLYDLSEDGVVNRPDDDVLTELVSKKLIRLYPRLEIVNVSFANFVRTVMQKNEIQKMEVRENKDGRWKHIRILLIIIILAALAFLSIAEETFFGRATAVIGSITLLLPNLLNLLGSMTKLLTKSSASTISN